ncbi:hypothetical protein CPB86DRAFT_782652 [Serendipita vermifera]|nr:hypothetical protein CPB86DRAFT_782652 [Serendipita vermifera]
MGHKLSPPPATPSLLTRHRVPTLMSTIIPLRSLAVLGGVFDTPVDKCPPVGSMGYVTGISSSVYSKAPPMKVNTAEISPYPSPSTPPSAPIHFVKPRQSSNNQLATPPLTPENSIAIPHPKKHSALAETLFVENTNTITKFCAPLQIVSNNTAWDAFVLDLPNRPKTLYVDGQAVRLTDLRESVVALLDLADEQLECSSVIFALPRSAEGLDDLIHSLMYVGGQLVTRPWFKTNTAYLLMGLEI